MCQPGKARCSFVPHRRINTGTLARSNNGAEVIFASAWQALLALSAPDERKLKTGQTWHKTTSSNFLDEAHFFDQFRRQP